MRKWFLRYYQNNPDFRLTAVCMFVFDGCWVVFGILWMVFDIARGLVSEAVKFGLNLLFALAMISFIFAGIAAAHAVIEDLQKKE